ncbi:MAG: hypothetical protein ACFCGT_20425 [Sandaracinaceae bacterium]
MRGPHAAAVAGCAIACLAAGCAPTIGDSCQTSLDCSLNNDRQCDRTVQNGQCTIFSCEADSCPDGSNCVRFRPAPTRLSFTACMRPCRRDGGCRFDAGFRCFTEESAAEADLAIEILDSRPNGPPGVCLGTVLEED